MPFEEGVRLFGVLLRQHGTGDVSGDAAGLHEARAPVEDRALQRHKLGQPLRRQMPFRVRLAAPSPRARARDIEEHEIHHANVLFEVGVRAFGGVPMMDQFRLDVVDARARDTLLARLQPPRIDVAGVDLAPWDPSSPPAPASCRRRRRKVRSLAGRTLPPTEASQAVSLRPARR